jgi:hypothetical protein
VCLYYEKEGEKGNLLIHCDRKCNKPLMEWECLINSKKKCFLILMIFILEFMVLRIKEELEASCLVESNN